MKITSLFIMAAMTYSCSAKKIAVSSADFILENQIEKRLPLYADQKESLSKDVDKFLNDQKVYTKELISVITDIELDVKKIDLQYDHLQELYKKIAFNFSDLMSKYMSVLDEKQQKDFNRILKEENHKLAGKKNEVLDKTKENFERLLGNLKTNQEKILESYKNHLLQRYELRLKRRQALHDRFAEILNMELSKDGKTKYLSEAFKEYVNTYPDHPMNKEIIKKLIPTLSLAQKETFESKIKEVKEIINYYIEANY